MDKMTKDAKVWISLLIMIPLTILSVWFAIYSGIVLSEIEWDIDNGSQLHRANQWFGMVVSMTFAIINSVTLGLITPFFVAKFLWRWINK